MSINDDVIVKAGRALTMLMQMEGEGERGRENKLVNAMKIHVAGGVGALLAQMRRYGRVYMFVCMYVRMYTYRYINTCTHIYIYREREKNIHAPA
jgi:hypothetical protein